MKTVRHGKEVRRIFVYKLSDVVFMKEEIKLKHN
jgi:hypothetical protein